MWIGVWIVVLYVGRCFYVNVIFESIGSGINLLLDYYRFCGVFVGVYYFCFVWSWYFVGVDVGYLLFCVD